MDHAGTEYDVVVVGSGGAGMTAALAAAHHGLRTVVIESSAWFGGSTSRSGGGVWIPDNYALRAAGRGNPAEESRTYLHAIIGDAVPRARVDAFLDRGPEALAFVRDHSAARFVWVPDYSDYYPEAPGGQARGRSVEPVPVDGRILGDELARLHPAYTKAPVGMVVMQADYRWLSLGLRTLRGPLTMLKVGLRRILNMVLRRPMYGMGQAMTIGLRKGLLDAGVPILYETPLTGLVVEDGRVTGVHVTRDGEPATLRARHGVVLASGGFEKNQAMREQHQRSPVSTDWTTGAPSNTGGGITAAVEVGAAVDLMDDAWWGPSIPLPSGPWFCLAERNLPGSIIVNQAGRRYANEAAPYVDAVHAMYDGEAATGISHVPSWMVLDQRYRNRYLFAGLGPRQPFPRRWYESGVVVRADTLEELAERTGVDPAGLLATVGRFNAMARDRCRRGLPPRRLGLRQVLRRPQGPPQPLPRPHRPAAVLRGHAGARRPGHQGRRGHRRAGARAAPGRVGHRGALRRRQRRRGGDGPHLRRGRGDHRAGGHLRLRRRARHRRAGARPAGRRRLGEGELSMPIDPEQAVGATLADRTFAWSPSDVLLYHLAVGAGSRPGDQTDPAALRYTLDDERLQVLPSFGVVAPSFHDTDAPGLELPGCDLDLAQVLHGSQEIELHAPLPTSTEAVLRTRIADVWDKGKAAVIVQEGTATTDDGTPLFTTRSSIFVRGEGGWGGDRGPSTTLDLPDRAPDAEASYATTPAQALLYRLCGDRNPLHADPGFARAAGFPAPDPARAVLLRDRPAPGRRRPARRGRVAGPRLPRPVRRGGLPGRDDPGTRLARGRAGAGDGEHRRPRGRA